MTQRWRVTKQGTTWRYYNLLPGKLWPHEMSRPYPTEEEARAAGRLNADRLDTE